MARLGPTVSGWNPCHYTILSFQRIPRVRTHDSSTSRLLALRAPTLLGLFFSQQFDVNCSHSLQLHVAATLAIVFVAITYWYTWAKVLPRLGGYRLEREVVIQEDGVSRTVLKKVR